MSTGKEKRPLGRNTKGLIGREVRKGEKLLEVHI